MCAGTKREVISALLRLAKVPPGELAMLLSEAPLSLMLVGAPSHARAPLVSATENTQKNAVLRFESRV